jgi:hypothetical protein
VIPGHHEEIVWFQDHTADPEINIFGREVDCTVSDRLPAKRDSNIRSTVPEVEFALVLSRLIEAAHSDPGQLRSSIYQIARVRLQEQLALETPAEAQHLLQALEKAIEGVELFAQRNAISGPGRFLHSEPRLDGISGHWAKRELMNGLPPGGTAIDHHAPSSKSGGAWISGLGSLAFIVRSIGVLAVISVLAVIGMVAVMGAVAHFAFDQRRNPPLAGLRLSDGPSQAAGALPFRDKRASIDHAPVSTRARPSQDSPLPDHFGVFAVSANELHELEQLPGRAPDLRVAISAAIAQPAKTTIADGRVKFVVYRRDSMSSAVERAEVRLMARIARGLTFEASGKPTMAQDDETRWVIRNISYPLRVAPVRDVADMYELRSEDSEFAFTPGRYVLVIKGVAYDFAVRGDVIDPKQCLERIQAANGIFYTECRKP